jgi:hypothetical protein
MICYLVSESSLPFTIEEFIKLLFHLEHSVKSSFMDFYFSN